MSQTILLIATQNEHKLNEIRDYLGHNYLVKGLIQLGLNDDIPETGNSFKENALLKASYLYDRFNQFSLGEDSGLVVPALGGAPGIYSARYAMDSNLSNLEFLLSQLKNNENRSAYYITVIALKSKNLIQYFEGKCHGTISTQAMGNNGFGYDPIFIPNSYKKTFGQLDKSIKLKISHRTKALQNLIAFLKQ